MPLNKGFTLSSLSVKSKDLDIFHDVNEILASAFEIGTIFSFYLVPIVL
jgi:hypothetical protein